MRTILGVTPGPNHGEQRRTPGPTERDVRELLRMLRRPFLLEQNQLALLLKKAYGTADPVAAVHAMIKESISDSPAFGDVYSEIIQRCDVRAESTKQAAASMNMSVRTFFRFRKDALLIVMRTVTRRLRSAASATQIAPEPRCLIHGASSIQAAS